MDTNILVSALLVDTGAIGDIYRAFASGAFTALVCEEQFRELRLTLAKPALAARIRPHNAGRLLNTLRRLAEDVGTLTAVERSCDPNDDFLLAMVEAGKADYLVTGDKSGLLVLGRHKGARILPARDFAALIR